MSLRIAVTTAATALLVASCSSTSSSSSVGVAPTLSAYDAAVQRGQAYTLLVMRRGPALDTIGAEEIGEITRAHMDFTAAMVEEGSLLVSGPVVAPRSDRTLRSFAVAASADTRDVYASACSDPACEAGALECEAVPFVSQDDLRAIPAMDRGLHLERGTDEIIARPYVMIQVPTSPATEAMIARMDDVVIFSGACTAGTFEGSTLIAVDCRTAAEARALMGAMGPAADDFVYHPWVSSQCLEELLP